MNTVLKIKFGQINNAHGEKLKEVETSADSKVYDVDFSKSLQKTTIKRNVINKQLFTGHIRLDLGQPLSQGNVIIFKGERKLGKIINI